MGDGDEARHRDRDHSKHRHRHHDDRERDRDRHHRKKKRRREDDEGDDRERRHRHRRDDEKREKSPEKKSLADELADDFDEDMWEEKRAEGQDGEGTKEVERESWMTGEKNVDEAAADPFSSLLGAVRTKEKKQPVVKPNPEEALLNHPRLLNKPVEATPEIRVEDTDDDEYKPPSWLVGDSGSEWRMMKLKNLYTAAKESMRPVEEMAIERLGSLRAFDEAREEEMELERRKRDRRGEGVMKHKITGELYAKRLAKEKKRAEKDGSIASKEILLAPPSVPVAVTEPLVTQTDLNKLQASILRAEMTSSPDLEKLRQEYSALVDKFNTQPSQPEIIALPASHSQLVAHLSREQSLSSTEMTIEDMVKEERAFKRSSNVDRIMRDKTYRNDLDYIDENAEKLATVTKRKEVDLKNMTIQDYKKQQQIMEKCPLCFKEDGSGRGPLAPVIGLGTRTYLSLPTEPELTKDGCMIVPLRHARNLADCDDDEWEEIRVASQTADND
jgi:Protein similar to CwfJ C-terminus 1